MKRRKRPVGRRAWLMRAAVMGAAVAVSAGAPVAGIPATPLKAGVEAAGEQKWERVIRLGRFRICWGICRYGWCCYDNPYL